MIHRTLRRCLVLSLAAASLAASAGPAGADRDAFERELEARRERWTREAGAPAAAIAVLGTLELWEHVEPAALVAFLEAAAADGRAHPLARAEAAWLAEEAAARLGRASEAAEHRRRLGLLAAWRVIGPFPDVGGEGFEQVFPPEEAAVAGAELPADAAPMGKRGAVRWRTVPEALVPHGVVPLGGLLRPDSEAVAYAETWVRSAGARDVALRLGSTGPIKAWVNGRPVVAHDAGDRPVHIDQDVGAARLEAGWNQILVKVSVHEGPWSFVARLTAPDGAAVGSVVTAAAPPAAGDPRARPAAARGRGMAARAVAELGPLLEVRARRAPAGPARVAAWRDVALFRAHVVPDGRAPAPVEDALRRAGWNTVRCAPGTGGRARRRCAPAAVETLLVAARHAETPDARRGAAEGILDRADGREPGDAPGPAQVAEAAYRLAVHYAAAAGIPARAVELHRRALAADPAYWPAELALAGRLADLGLLETARARVAAVAQARPGAGLARRELADLDRRAGRIEEARRLLGELLRVRQEDPGVLAELADLAAARGDHGAAIAMRQQLVAGRPHVAGAHTGLADALLDAGDVEGAVAALDAGLAVAPEDEELLERSGRVLAERAADLRQPEARRLEGVERLKRALVLRPQNPDLRRYLARLRPEDDRDLEKHYARPAAEVLRAHRDFRPGRPPVAPGAHTTVLLDLKVTRVHDNGLSETLVQRLVRAEDELGAEEESVQAVQYTPDTQTVEIREARVHRPDGTVLQATSRDDRSISEPWTGMYYDVRSELVGFGRLEPGDVVEVIYVLSDVGRRNLFADYFGDLYFFREGAARAESEYVLLAPPGRRLHFDAPTAPWLERSEDERDGERRYRFRARALAAVEIEDRMPGWTEAAPFLHVSTYRTWDEIARWYARLIAGQLVADDAVRSAAREATRGLREPAAKVRAIYNLVVEQTRYVALEFGIHGFKPYRVPVVFARKFGDCKDKASLIVTMLREVGVEAHLVLVRTRAQGDVGEGLASLAVFDHAIAYVPALDLFLDGTAEFSGSTELPWGDQGVMALIVDGAGGRLARTPVHDAATNTVARTLRLALAPDGGARLAEDLEIRGQAAAGMRRVFQSLAERRDRYEVLWNGFFAGARVERVEMPDLADRERPVRIRAEGTAPEIGRARAGGGRVIPALGRTSELARSYGATSARIHDLVVEYPWVQQDTLVYELPPTWKVHARPRPAEVVSPFGRLDLGVTEAADGRTVTVRAALRVDARRVAPGDYAAWREFLVAVDAALDERLEVGP